MKTSFDGKDVVSANGEDVENQMNCSVLTNRSKKQLVCGGCSCISVLVLLIVILTSIYDLGPAEQLLVKDPAGHYVQNGPWRGVLITVHGIETREAVLLKTESYAHVQNSMTGEARNAEGPQLLFLGPYDSLEGVRSKTLLQDDQYVVLKSGTTGEQRHISGPQLLTPGAYDEVLEVRQKHLLQEDEYAVVTSGISGEPRHVSGPQLLMLQAYDEFVETRSKLLLQEDQYVVMKSGVTGEQRHISGPQLLMPGEYDEVLEVHSKLLLQDNHYAAIRSGVTGEPSHVSGPLLLMPDVHDDVELHDKLLLQDDQYAIVRSGTGQWRHESGPQLLMPDVYDEVVSVESKIVLLEDQYIRFVDQMTGAERVLQGPQTLVPQPLETSADGIQRAVFLESQTAVLVLNRESGMQHLVTAGGAFIPNHTEEILQIQELVHVLPHEAVVVRDRQGQLTVHSGMSGDGTGTAFFLPPYSEIVQMSWSTYADGSSESHQMVSFDRIDMRAHKNLFKYEVQTRDNVRLALEGTIFWQVRDVPTMISATSDPQGDLWHRARSALIEAVSNTTLARFMSDFNGIVAQSFRNVERDSFFSERGVELQSMEVTSFSCADTRTGEILQEIIQETTNRINRLTVQESENEVRQAALSMDIQLERQRSELIQTRAENERLEAEMNGDAAGMRLMMAASTFIGGLNESVPNVTDRVDLYRMHQELSSRNADTQNLASGSAHLFLTPEDLKLRLTVGGTQEL